MTRQPKTQTYRSIDDFLKAVEEGKACNAESHSRVIAVMEPGTTKRCPVCKQPMCAAPIRLGES